MFISSFVSADMITASVAIDSNISEKDCIEAARSVRKEFYEDDFGEIIDGREYSLIRDKLHVTIFCLEPKELVVVFVAEEDGNPYKYIRRLEEQYTKKDNKALKKDAKKNNSAF